MKKILVCGAGGFIGSHLVRKLKSDGHFVVGADLKHPEFSKTVADEFHVGDLRRQLFVNPLAMQHDYDEVYQLAADMGGAGYIFTGDHDADVMHNSAQINLNIVHSFKNRKAKIFYSSSACVYPAFNQVNADDPDCSEDSAIPAMPDSAYGWEKLFSEMLYQNFAKNYQMDIRIARFHNIFGPEGTYKGGKEKAPAAICRKVITAGNYVEIWGTGKQTRSFLYIDECIEGIQRLMESDFQGPVNIGSDQMISIEDLTQMIIYISEKKLSVKYIDGPTGVMGRNSDNRLIQEKLNWKPTERLEKGIIKTFMWIKDQINK